MKRPAVKGAEVSRVMTDREREEAANKVAAFLSDRPVRRQRGGRACRSRAESDLAGAMADAKRRAESGDWEGATGRTLVGAFLLCHRMVYRFIPAEMENTPIFRSACKRAEHCYRRHFRDDPDACVEFIKWVWLRERSRQEWALRQNREVRRLHAGLVFSDGYVDDYRVHLQGARRHGGRRAQTQAG